MSLRDGTLRRSERRLWQLVDERSRHGADVKAIDERIWDLFGEEWAVMITDLAGFSRKTAEFGIIHFLQIIHEHRKLLLPVIDENDGVVVKVEADNLMVLFRQASSAVRCAVEMQRACQAASVRRKPEEQILLCVGIGCGRILRIGEHDVWGAEVNAASKLGEDTAECHDILITKNARIAAGDVSGVEFIPVDLPVPGSSENFTLAYRGHEGELYQRAR
jgi:class 3 adenylate cyclase